jgi:hypothetical protein
MTEQRPPSAWRLPVVLLLAATLNPLAIVAWILLSGDDRTIYWKSPCVKGGLVIAVIGSLPLLVVAVAAELGLWPDPDPNPIGFGLLFVFSVALGSLLALFGVLWTHWAGKLPGGRAPR